MFPCGICEIYKNTYFEEHLRRLLLKPVLSPGLPFLITYTTGSNWYLCFSFYIVIYSFVCQFCLHYYWSEVVLQVLQISQNSQENGCAKNSFLVKLQIYRASLYQKRDSGADFFLWILRNFSERIFFLKKKTETHLHKHSFCLCPTTNFRLFKNNVTHIFRQNFFSAYFVDW